ncbi:helix-turn-helix domain-containing protein [Altererythrobacter litoralis]|uniref:Helix-turn-helix domain-containing protein n=1 Tax=Altererythrobacter litoralis TaxID=3113904 RepID=A0ABU7GCT5_9SPHN|nr:helix-turn-helix domain-containing protein [Erythrobacteraceae bacterium 1XM1-14]
MGREGNRLTTSLGLRSLLGHTAAGEPLSLNRAPCEELSPWVARVYAVQVEAEPDHIIHCGLCADTPVLRVLLDGDWTAETRDGFGRYRSCAMFFGPQTRKMPVTVRGSFAAVGVALKPGAVAALKGPKVADMLDRAILYDHIYGDQEWGTSEKLIEWFDPSSPPQRWLRVAEILVGDLVERTGGAHPDPIVEAFDKAAFANPNMNIGDFADEHGIERRSFERMIKRAYGQTPKRVLRRARVLDIAANLRGVADDAEAEELALRYYDQSHMIREFVEFFGMTPRQFVNTPQPIMTKTLEARQARRLEVLGRHDPAERYPWRRGD